RRANAQWAHKVLLRQLPVPILATYINLLRYCKSVARYLVDILLKEQQNDDSITMANRLITSFMNNKILDPQTTPIAKTLGKRHLDCICLLAVDPYFAHLEYTPRIKAHEYLFKVLFPSSFGRVEQLRACLPSSVEFSAAEVVEYLVDIVSKRLKELMKKYPSKKVVLAGWGTSCFINHEVVQSVPNVHAILDFAFPLKTIDGMRGDADDTILLTYCPTLFVVGEQAIDCDTLEVQKLASKMKAFSGVVVVGAANSNLQMSPLHSSIERFTQKTVHRALIDDVIDFLEKVCAKNIPDSSLRPFPVVETSNADLSVMRGSTTSSRYIPKSRRQLDSVGRLEPGKKRFCSRERFF
uniref:DUF4470 domain-containing protein n=1 Tax=Syphacia muris TaxID=451379 RepID=A0A0N5B0D5_9BILA